MNNAHVKLVDTIMTLITKVYSDTSVSREETRESLGDIREHIEEQLAALEE